MIQNYNKSKTLNKKNILITGVTSGIGKSIVEKLISIDYKVIGIGRRKDRLDELGITFKDNFYGIELDITDNIKVNNIFSNLPNEFKNISKLINNAGLIDGSDIFLNTSNQSIQKMINTNIIGSLNITKAILSSLIDSKDGHIINITSIASSVYYPTGHVYASTKAFLEHFGNCLRTELYSKDIKISNIAPGRTKSEFVLGQFDISENEIDDKYKDFSPLLPEDIANTVKWVLSQPKHVNIDSINIMPSSQNLYYR